MPSPAGPAELLADLAAALDVVGARWYVFGAQAALVWGRPRLTTDVDVTVQCDVPTDRLVRALATYGFSLRIDATDAFVRTTRVVPLEHLGSGLAVDVVLAGPGLEELFLERAVPVDIAGISVPFISPEDLIVTKLLAGREKDVEDVRGVLAERGDALDLGRVRTTLRLLEERSDRAISRRFSTTCSSAGAALARSGGTAEAHVTGGHGCWRDCGTQAGPSTGEGYVTTVAVTIAKGVRRCGRSVVGPVMSATSIPRTINASAMSDR